jgi:hypothetical protein
MGMTFYANIVNVRGAGHDLVLEFGSFFPGPGRPLPPKDLPPDVRVVISSDLIGPLIQILRERLAPASHDYEDVRPQ